MAKRSKLTTSQVVQALKEKHCGDILITECKSGSSMGGHFRLDAWMMKKSWANQCFTGYEVKVDRSDFMNDTKWPNYLPFCNEFYFVCPSGLISPDEVGEKAGLMYVSETGSRMWRKKKAPWLESDIEQLNQLLQYVMMYRTKIVSSTFGTRDCGVSKKAYWETWLANKQLNREFGNHVGSQISKTIREKINNVARENQKLEHQIQTYSWLESFLKEQGLSIHSTTWKLSRDIEKLSKIVPDSVFESLQRAQEAFSGCQSELTKLLEDSHHDVPISK